MDGLSRLVLAVAGGGLLVYGFMSRAKTRTKDPYSPNLIDRITAVPDEGARTDGNLALFMGGAFVLSAIFL